MNGYVLPIVLICSTLMVMMANNASKILISLQKSVSNYEDIKLAERYAYETMLSAESFVYEFDIKNNLESPNILCNVAASYLVLNGRSFSSDDCISIRRGYALLKALDNSFWQDEFYKKGFWYKRIVNQQGKVVKLNSDFLWQPWRKLSSQSVLANKPCNSYTYHYHDQLPLIDDRNNRYSISYNTKDYKLCTNPRFIIEPISLDYRGTYIATDNPNYEQYFISQNNNDKQFISYKSLFDEDGNSKVIINSSRLYRITVVAFGRSGDSRVTLQEIVAVNQYNKEDLRIIDDGHDKLIYRIVRLSFKVLNSEI